MGRVSICLGAFGLCKCPSKYKFVMRCFMCRGPLIDTAYKANNCVAYIWACVLDGKHKMQIRTLRQTHVDSEYCNDLFKSCKGTITELTIVLYGINPNMIKRIISVDNKSKVSI